MAPKNKPTTAKGAPNPPADKNQPTPPATDGEKNAAGGENGPAASEGDEIDAEFADPDPSPMSFAVLLMLLHRELRLDEIMARFVGNPENIDQLAGAVQKRFKSAMERRGTTAMDMMTGIETVLAAISKLV